MKVLFVGNNPNTIIEPLSGFLKHANPDIHITTAGLTDPSSQASVDTMPHSAIDKIAQELDPRIRYAQKNQNLPTSSSSKNTGGSSGRLKRYVARAVYRRTRPLVHHWVKRAFNNLLRDGYDLVHVQSLFDSPILDIVARQQTHPLVVSCWGSDVFRSCQISQVATQQKVLRRADAITATGPEFREVVLSKYGRDLRNRLHNTFFSPSLETVTRADADSSRQDFRRRLQVPQDQLIICIGHNAHQEGQHVDLISGVRKLRENTRKRLHLVMPMTYGGSVDYRREVADAVANTGCPFTILDEFLTDDEVAQLRHGSDLFLYAPISDAFSATVSQALAAGSVCVLGSWLPYKLRSRAGFQFWEIDSAGDVATPLQEILDNWSEAKQKCEKNRTLSTEFFDPLRLGNQWLAAYHAAINNFRKKHDQWTPSTSYEAVA